VVIFLTLIVAVAKSKRDCWKVIIILLFTILSTTFGFGGLGIVYSCMVHHYDPTAIPSSFLTQNYFIQIIVYSMLVFIVMYILLVPLTSWLEERRDPQKERTGCECCLYAFYLFCQFLLLVGMVGFVAVVLGGVPVLFYLLNGITKSRPMTQTTFFALAINCLVSPYFVGLVAYIFGRFFGCGSAHQ